MDLEFCQFYINFVTKDINEVSRNFVLFSSHTGHSAQIPPKIAAEDFHRLRDILNKYNTTWKGK